MKSLLMIIALFPTSQAMAETPVLKTLSCDLYDKFDGSEAPTKSYSQKIARVSHSGKTIYVANINDVIDGLEISVSSTQGETNAATEQDAISIFMDDQLIKGAGAAAGNGNAGLSQNAVGVTYIRPMPNGGGNANGGKSQYIQLECILR